MASVITFIRPFRPNLVNNILVVQSGPLELTLEVVDRLRTIFSKSTIEGVVCEEDRELLTDNKFDSLTIVRWEERFSALRRLRRKRYDVIVVLYSHLGSYNLRLLPYLLRTRSILIFNENMDYFPLNIWRLSALSQHISGSRGPISLLFWVFFRIVLVPLAAVLLLGSIVYLYLRGGLRRFIRFLRHLRLQSAAKTMNIK
jgi:hypothetical protein